MTTYTDGYGGDIATYCDTGIYSDGSTLNGGIATLAYIKYNTYKELMRFDLSSIPAGSTCVSATLYITSSVQEPSQSIDVYSVAVGNTAWIEGTKNDTTAGAGEPCWNALAADGAATSVTDYEASALGSINLNGVAANIEVSCALDTTRIAGWFGSPNTNYGLLLHTAYTGWDIVFWSSDCPTLDRRPRLVVVYSVGGTSTPKTLTGGDTPSGTIAKQIQKLFTGG
jgi:hypothetical protein